MGYRYLDYDELLVFCRKVFERKGFTADDAADIADIVLAADMNGTESHGVQRMVRYAFEIDSGLVQIDGKPEIVYDTPVSAVIDANNCMGQLAAKQAMELAITKAKNVGCGFVTVRRCNHYGIAGYYAELAANEDMIGICMTNTEAIMVPTYGKKPMIGTNPIAVAMPAEPCIFSFDCATTMVPRGKFEVYAKRGEKVPEGWGVDENGRDSTDAVRILNNIIYKNGGGILPLGGSSELMGGHKGYGFGMICELFTGILSGGFTSDFVNRGIGEGTGICQCFIAIDYGIFGDKAAIRKDFSDYLTRIRNSERADGCDRIYTHGEKEMEMREVRRKNGVPVNEKTMEELRKIGSNEIKFPAILG